MRIAGLIRKSPTNKKDEVNASIEQQRKSIKEFCERKFKDEDYVIDWYIDVASGDDPDRKEINRFFRQKAMYRHAVAYNVDRYSRSWLGIKWLHEHFLDPDKLMLHLVYEVPPLYHEGQIDSNSYLILGMFCIFAHSELIRNRQRQRKAIDRILADPKLRAQKYPGGKKVKR